MNKYLCVVMLMMVVGCNAGVDQGEVEDVCTKVVKDGLDQCTSAAWEQCSTAYDSLLDDLTKQNAALTEQIYKLQNAVELGCDNYVQAGVSDILHSYGCHYENQSLRWVCGPSSPICQPYDPNNP